MATRFNSRIKSFYQRLLREGKPKKVALTLRPAQVTAAPRCVNSQTINSRTLRIWSPNGKAPTPRKNKPFVTSPRKAAASWVSMQNCPQPGRPSRRPHWVRQSNASVQRGLTCAACCSFGSALS